MEGGLGGGGSSWYGVVDGFMGFCLQIMICKVWITMGKHMQITANQTANHDLQTANHDAHANHDLQLDLQLANHDLQSANHVNDF